MKKKISFLLILCIAISLLAIFTFYDLKVDIQLNNPNSIFGHVFAIIGPFPMYFAFLIGGLTLFRISSKNYLKIMGTIASLIGSLLICISPLDHFEIKLNDPIIIILSALCIFLLTTFLLLLVKRIPLEFFNKFKKFAFMYCLVAICALVSVTILKNIFGRVRFRDLSVDYKEYQRWYHVDFFSGNYSFPSGHTNSATLILMLNFLPLFFNIKKSNRAIILIVTYGFIILTALSRIILGAHYPTDTVAGFLNCFIIQQFLVYGFRKVDKKRQKYYNCVR